MADDGVEYFCDWVNDECRIAWNAPSGRFVAMPFASELQTASL